MHLELAIACALISSSASADQICASASLPLTPTNWNLPVNVPRFDPALGTLTAVEITVDCTMDGIADIESTDTIPVQFTTFIQSTLIVERPDQTSFVTMVPVAPFVDDLTAFDGTIDWGGTSGAQHGAAVQQTSTTISATAADLAIFSGPAGNPGTLDLPVFAYETSFVIGIGVPMTQFATQVGVDVTVCYDFDPAPVPFCFGDGTGTACPCGNASAAGAGQGCTSSLGIGAQLAGSGHASVAHDTLVMTCNGLPGTTSALLFQGTTQLAIGAGVVFGDGLRCAGGSIVRLGATLASGGVATWPLSGGPQLGALGGVTANAVRHYQTWYRNAVPFCSASTFNLSQALSVSWAP